MQEITPHDVEEVSGGVRVGVVLPGPFPIPMDPVNLPAPFPEPGCPAPEPDYSQLTR
jgi:hypothetical protein